MRGSLVEINLTGCARAFDVSPIGCEIQIGFKNLGLRVVPLQFECANNLDELSAKRAGAEMITQPSQLHRNCRCSAMYAVGSQVKGRAQYCEWVNTWVVPIIFVFEPEGRIDQSRRNVWQRSPESKFLIGREGNAKQFSIAIAHTLRKRDFIQQGRFRQR